MSLSEPRQNELADMLRYKRPMGSASEAEFKNKFLMPLKLGWDKIGNGYLKIDGAPIIWSCHTDTVHTTDGRQSITALSAIKDQCFIALEGKSSSNCLGADCTTGVWIMMNMIRNKVPGLYIFHHGEEKGCIGSRAISLNNKKELSTYKAAIAFDRMGRTDIVRYQRGKRCCSDSFVTSLAKALNNNYSASSGVYTDTGEYTDLVPECTNISVGYFHQHSSNEYQDVEHALWLARRMCEADFTSLVYERNPKAADEYEYSGYHYGGTNGGYYGGGRYYRRKADTLFGLVNDRPYATAKILEAMGITFEEFEEAIKAYDANEPLPQSMGMMW